MCLAILLQTNSAILVTDNLGQVVTSDLSWGLILYGEEEEKVMAASTDPVISKIWKLKEEVPLDDTYAVLKAHLPSCSANLRELNIRIRRLRARMIDVRCRV